MIEIIDKTLEEKFQITDYPLNIPIEITNHCNLNCIMCKNDKLTRSRGYMSSKLYRKIIDETAQENPHTRIWLDFCGEALLAGWKLYWMIDYAKKKGLTNVCINTNGTLLNEEYADMMLDSGIDYISIDCDGFSKEVYESIRIRANRDRFYNNIEYLLNEKKRRNAKTIIDIKIVKMKENEHEVNKVIDYWSERGAWTAIRQHSIGGPGIDDDTEVDNSDRIACGNAIGQLPIAWNGIAGGCAWDFDTKIILGNVQNETIKNIWKYKIDTLIKCHMQHKWDELPPICKTCTNWKTIGEMRFDENKNPVIRKYGSEQKIHTDK